MNNKTELLEAIEDYDVLTKRQKSILKTLVDIAIDNKVITTYRKLSAILDTTPVTIYTAIKKFEKNEIIEASKEKGVSFYTFKLNDKKLDKIIKAYQKRKIYLKN